MSTRAPLPVIDLPAADRGDDREARLAAEGWTRRFAAAAPRVKEHVETYESLGLEVRLEPILPDELAPECGHCALALGLFRVIYTRRPS
jgi:hypothetical protein